MVAGSAVRYTIAVTNSGEAPYAPAVLSDPLADLRVGVSHAPYRRVLDAFTGGQLLR